jgi:hypothetical protein
MKATLKEIIRKASKDKKFLNALTKSARGALKDYDLELSTSDFEVLRNLIGGKGSTKERRLLRSIAVQAGFGMPWPPPWDKLFLRDIIKPRGLKKGGGLRPPKGPGR